MRALHICSQLSKSRINKNHFKLVSRLPSCGKKKTWIRKFPSVAKTETESPESQAGDKIFGAGKVGDKKKKVRFPQTGQESKLSRQTHAHTHIKPIWKSKWNHMWEELKFFLCFPINSPSTCSGIFKYKFCASFSLAEVATCAEDYFYFVAGKFLVNSYFLRHDVLLGTTRNNYPQRGRWEKKKKICVITTAQSNRISLFAWRRCRQ